MKQEEINERNIAIQKFINPAYKGWTEDLKYNESMDWLYPVCQKINHMLFTSPMPIEIADLGKTVVDGLCRTLPCSKLFIRVSDFCKEYNLIHNKG